MDTVRITRIVARLNVGGPAVHIVNLMGALDPVQFQNELIVGLPSAHEGDMSYLADEMGIRPRVIPELGREISPLDDLVALVKLIRMLRRWRPHIVETHTAKAGTIGRLAAHFARVPVIVHVFHGHVFHSYFGPLKTRAFIAIERQLARITDCIVTISPAQRRDITDTYRVAQPEKTIIIPLGLDLQRFTEAGQCPSKEFRASVGIRRDAPVVGFVGRLASVKNPTLFIKAARLVAEEIPETHFVLVGDGELRPVLQTQVETMSLGQQIVFAGWREDMTAVYADLDVMALTSRNEGTPVTVIEALAAGVPVVATAVGGVPDVISDERTGLLAPSDDAHAIARATLKLLRNPGYAHDLATRGQAEVMARFNVERLASDMECLYRRLLKEKGIRLESGS